MNTLAKRYRTLWLFVLVTTAIATTIDLLALATPDEKQIPLPLALSLVVIAWVTAIFVARENHRSFRNCDWQVTLTIILAALTVLFTSHTAITPTPDAPAIYR